MVIEYTEELKRLAHEICVAGAKPYTDEQIKEIPNIINAKSRYFWGNDLNDWEVLRDVLTEEGFCAYWDGQLGVTNRDDQVEAAREYIGQGDMIPMHFAHNQIVQFLDDTHARLLTRMHDYHTYMDNGEVYSGYGMYVDDLVKCNDGVWRIETIRLDRGVVLGALRSQELEITAS
ncbi:nuclear transport factor 2 family protein [Paenibacillus polymyxa]|uniref:nuclear transport factor 2 family protein n=1 Tax=Paenibacillus polymyxa TaxID=1406 RepID=UPI002AB45BB0|nr:nuclear transport factor 2 family protein [Paenibacillus polymyxa]MDY8024383.1 nuclear transport factor 2 family protein [Paenibacillus polymyxa]